MPLEVGGQVWLLRMLQSRCSKSFYYQRRSRCLFVLKWFFCARLCGVYAVSWQSANIFPFCFEKNYCKYAAAHLLSILCKFLIKKFRCRFCILCISGFAMGWKGRNLSICWKFARKSGVRWICGEVYEKKEVIGGFQLVRTFCRTPAAALTRRFVSVRF